MVVQSSEHGNTQALGGNENTGRIGQGDTIATLSRERLHCFHSGSCHKCYISILIYRGPVPQKSVLCVSCFDYCASTLLAPICSICHRVSYNSGGCTMNKYSTDTSYSSSHKQSSLKIKPVICTATLVSQPKVPRFYKAQRAVKCQTRRSERVFPSQEQVTVASKTSTAVTIAS